jgi:CarboxypepD_reg-like domain
LKKRTYIIFLFLSFIASKVQSQLVQTVRGTVSDALLKSPLVGANIVWLNSEPLRGATTDTEGVFRFDKIAVGRQSFRVSFVGYKEIFLNNISVEAGKETILNIELEEDIRETNAVIVTAQQDKTQALNDLAVVSARMFSVEETRRFAAGLNDPARMATAFAGVTGGNGDGNSLVIRGNAPNGLLWRMEGVDIPNPNHFARVGTSGGGISILSAQLLSNSDFLSGAFPSEYGNALSAVFDLKLRKGNNEKREYTFAASIIGIDAAAEGYFKKGYKGSYLVNYRYGFLSFLQKLGLNVGDAPTEFQDLSFNISLPSNHLGNFTVFGFGGLSNQIVEAVRDSNLWKKDASSRSGRLDASNTGALGATHSIILGKKTALKSVVSLNQYQYKEEDTRLDKQDAPLIINRDNRFGEYNAIVSTVLNHKINVHHSLRMGFYTTFKGFDLQQREAVNNKLSDKIKTDGNTALINTFGQWKWQITEGVRFQLGGHVQHLILNKTSSFEPRAAFSMALSKKHIVALGYGLHGQIQPIGNYFARIAVGKDTVLANKNLDFTQSQHWVLGYDWLFAPNWRLKTELYYQGLGQVPVTAGKATNFSIINLNDDFAIEPLKNDGSGKNYGLEWTLERFWTDNFYLIATLSLFNSKYKPSDGIWRNTRYNANTAATFLMGKEWTFKNRKRPAALGVDVKFTHSGGQRVVPIDLIKSTQQKRTVTDINRIYEEKLPAFYRLDIQAEWKIQYRTMTGSTIIGVQNATNRLNPIRQSFNVVTNKIQYSYLMRIIPVIGYKIEF